MNLSPVHQIFHNNLTTQFCKSIRRLSINCDTSEYVTLLHGATGSLQSFEAAFQKYVLLISGYDEDQRELYQIPEVVSFIKDLNSKLPFWLYFVNTGDKRFFSWMIACLFRAMSLDQDDETIYADFDADA